MGEICFSPVLSSDDNLSRYEQIAQASDAKMCGSRSSLR